MNSFIHLPGPELAGAKRSIASGAGQRVLVGLFTTDVLDFLIKTRSRLAPSLATHYEVGLTAIWGCAAAGGGAEHAGGGGV